MRLLRNGMTRKKEHKVHLVIPKKGTKEKLVELAVKKCPNGSDEG